MITFFITNSGYYCGGWELDFIRLIFFESVDGQKARGRTELDTPGLRTNPREKKLARLHNYRNQRTARRNGLYSGVHDVCPDPSHNNLNVLSLSRPSFSKKWYVFIWLYNLLMLFRVMGEVFIFPFYCIFHSFPLFKQNLTNKIWW